MAENMEKDGDSRLRCTEQDTGKMLSTFLRFFCLFPIYIDL
jgi:hypothetical protein